jgi:hypothetical protein
MKLKCKVFAVVVGLLIAGCTTVRYEYQPPPSESGKMCVTQCQGIREVCRGNEINRVQAERQSCERRSENVFRDCQRNAKGAEEAKKCYRPACHVPENYWRCDESFRQCFEGCGGTIQKFTE